MPVRGYSVVHVSERERREVFRCDHGRRASWREARIQERERRSGVTPVLVEKMADTGAVEQRVRRLHH